MATLSFMLKLIFAPFFCCICNTWTAGQCSSFFLLHPSYFFCLFQLMAKHAIDYSVFGGPQNFGKWMDVHSAPSCPTEVIKRSISMVALDYFWCRASDCNMGGYCCFLFRAQARAPVEHLIGQFASRMTGLLGKLVEGWTSLSGSDSDAIAS